MISWSIPVDPVPTRGRGASSLTLRHPEDRTCYPPLVGPERNSTDRRGPLNHGTVSETPSSLRPDEGPSH